MKKSRLHPVTYSVVRLGVCIGMCQSAGIPLPPSAKKFFKHAKADTPLDDINEDEVWTAVRDMMKILDARNGEGFSQKIVKLTKDQIERISSLRSVKERL